MNGIKNDLINYVLRIADNNLILGHRISEWCGHGPVLEQDIAMTNIALDLIGQANLYLSLAAELKADGSTADDLAFLRDCRAQFARKGGCLESAAWRWNR